ncbi:MAG: class I SAM-dependent methyltransferase [Bacteroidota bacterium]
MIAKLFLYLCNYPVFRRIVWKPIYENLARQFDFDDWHFMNYGYAPLNGTPTLSLNAEDENDRYCIQLYHEVAAQVDLRDKAVLEVGSGRGGGASYVARYLQPAKMIGMDLASNAVAFAKSQHDVQGLDYVQGNAEALPFDDASFDAVINVESCHAYGSVENFLKEVKRVLKPGGHFLVTDLRLAQSMDILRKQLNNSGLNMLDARDIGPNVVRAIELDDDYKTKRIKERIPGWLEKNFAQFAGVKGSEIHLDLMSGDRVYWLFLLQKPE